MSNLDSRSIFSANYLERILLAGEMQLLISGLVVDKQGAERAGVSECFIAVRESRILDLAPVSNRDNIKAQAAEIYFGLNNHRFVSFWIRKAGNK